MFVVFHGTTVALLNKQPFWTMFCFGFLAMFIITQVHGITRNKVIRLIAIILYIIGAGMAYYYRGYGKLFEITYIPVILYGAAFILALMVNFSQKIVKRMSE